MLYNGNPHKLTEQQVRLHLVNWFTWYDLFGKSNYEMEMIQSEIVTCREYLMYTTGGFIIRF